MSSEIIEEDVHEDTFFMLNKEAQKQKIRHLLKHQKNQYNSSCSSSSSCSSYSLVAQSSSFSSLDKSQSRKLLNLMKKGSTSLRRLFDMEHTSLANHFEYYSGSCETKTIPLWGSDSDDGVHDDPWFGITKFDRGLIQVPQENERRAEEEKEEDEHQECKKTPLKKQKLTRKKSFAKLPSFYKFRLRAKSIASKLFRYASRHHLLVHLYEHQMQLFICSCKLVEAKVVQLKEKSHGIHLWNKQSRRSERHLESEFLSS
nr:hypothetical protein [Tanacetum cinerariifolium]